MIITGVPTTPTLPTEAAHKNYAQQTISLPVGTILMFAGTSENVPIGFLLCNGGEISQSVYPQLFGYYQTLSFPYGTGNGSTTCNLPNLKSRFPIGVGTNVSSLGSTGGTLNHVHTMGDHTHTQTHTHSMSHTHNIDHNHTINHKHSIAAHTHDMDHIHWVPAHYHGVSGSASGANHSHFVPTSNATAAGASGIRGGTTTTPSYTYNTGAATGWTATTGGSVGNTAIRNGNSGFWSGTSIADTTSGNPVSGSITSTYTGSTTAQTINTQGPSVANLDSYTSNTGNMTTSENVTASNPAFLVVNFIVKT
jgi:microcystin-dependent protein